MGSVTCVDFRAGCDSPHCRVGLDSETVMEKLEFGFGHGYTKARLYIFGDKPMIGIKKEEK